MGRASSVFSHLKLAKLLNSSSLLLSPSSPCSHLQSLPTLFTSLGCCFLVNFKPANTLKQ